jgi:hypothetical protein
MPAKSSTRAQSSASPSRKRATEESSSRQAARNASLPQANAPRVDAAKASRAVKLGKRLEAVARGIKDSDEFVEHVAGLAKRYRRERALRAGDTQAELRQSLRTFHKHASALTEWLQQATGGKANALERKAFDALGTKLFGSPVLARPQSAQTLEWLVRASKAADETVMELKQGGAEDALKIAAEGLRATFEHHKLKLATGSDKQPGDAVRLLCAIARDAGDTVEPAAAKAVLRETHRAATATQSAQTK